MRADLCGCSSQKEKRPTPIRPGSCALNLILQQAGKNKRSPNSQTPFIAIAVASYLE